MPTCADPNIKIWNRIPDGSQLELRVVGHPDPADDQFTANARLIVTESREENWRDDQLRPGPKRKTLRSPKAYDIRVRVAFAQADSAQVQARIIKPDGSTHGKPYCHPMTGTAGDIRRATILAVTLKE